MKDRARVIYQRTGKAPTIKELEIGEDELKGSYFDASNYSCGGSTGKWVATCKDCFIAGEPRDLVLTADLEKGSASFNR